MGWRGPLGPFGAIVPGTPGGGGFVNSATTPGWRGAILPGMAGGGGRIPSSAAPLAGLQGCGGPGPGALIGLSR